MVAIVTRLLEQFFGKKATNIFPAKHIPESMTDLLERGAINPYIPVPENFRGTLAYDYENCIGCVMCERICPANAVESYPVMDGEKKSKRVVFYLGRCTYCAECVAICPKDVIWMEKTFLNANYDKYGDSQVIGIEERKKNELKDGDAG